MSDVWEPLIRTTRKVLHALTREVLNDEGISTLMVLVEAKVNGRPLIHVLGDVKDLEPLTRNHLLLLLTGTDFPIKQVDNFDVYAKHKWR